MNIFKSDTYKLEFNNEPRVPVLFPGDILLKRNLDGYISDPIGRVISLMQSITVSSEEHLDGSYASGHAALYTGNGSVAEATGDGVVLNNLDDLKHTRYIVYRCINVEAAARAAEYGRRLTVRTNGGGAYSLGGAFASLLTTKRVGERGRQLLNNVHEFVTQENHNLMVPDFFCSMFVFTVYEVALQDQRFDLDPYSIDPKFYHKILNLNPQLFQKMGKYIHAHSDDRMYIECQDSVQTAINSYRMKRQNQSFKFLRSQSGETSNAIKMFEDTLEACKKADDGDLEAKKLLVLTSLYYTHCISEFPKFFPDTRMSQNEIVSQCRRWLGEPLGRSSTFIEELDKTSFFRRLKSIRRLS